MMRVIRVHKPDNADYPHNPDKPDSPHNPHNPDDPHDPDDPDEPVLTPPDPSFSLECWSYSRGSPKPQARATTLPITPHTFLDSPLAYPMGRLGRKDRPLAEASRLIILSLIPSLVKLGKPIAPVLSLLQCTPDCVDNMRFTTQTPHPLLLVGGDPPCALASRLLGMCMGRKLLMSECR